MHHDFFLVDPCVELEAGVDQRRKTLICNNVEFSDTHVLFFRFLAPTLVSRPNKRKIELFKIGVHNN